MTRNQHTHGWTDEQDAELRKLVGEGMSGGQIAKAMAQLRPGVNRLAVCGRVHRLGLRLSSNIGGAVTARKRKASKPAATPSAQPRNRKYEGTHERAVKKIVAPPPADPVRAHAFDPLPGVKPMALMHRRASQCAWPVGEPPSPSEQLCCGAPVASMEADAPPYCGAHMKLRRGAPLRPIKIWRAA